MITDKMLRDLECAIVVGLTQAGIPADVQAILCQGDKRAGVAPLALRKALAKSFADCAPLIRNAALEEAALEIDCNCQNKDQILRCTPNSAAKWSACGREECAAIIANDIRALKTTKFSS